jgi:hypothetical protein
MPCTRADVDTKADFEVADPALPTKIAAAENMNASAAAMRLIVPPLGSTRKSVSPSGRLLQAARPSSACEHLFVTSQGHPYAEFKRALEGGNLWVAEAAARDLPQVSLEDALRLVRLYGECGSPKFERAAIKWLQRYLGEGSPEPDVAKVVAGLVEGREAPYG